VTREQFKRHLRAALARAERLKPFIDRASVVHKSPDHVAPVREATEEARHRPVRALISMPPRFVKSTTVCGGLAYHCTYAPALHHAYCSATSSLGKKQSAAIRRMLDEVGTPYRGTAAEWFTGFGGGLKAVGLDGQYMGTGTTGIQVTDDPYPTWKHAFSAAFREHVWTWFHGTAANRCEPKASRMVIHTRYSALDLIGRLLQEEPYKWRHIRIPAIQGYNHDAAEIERRKEEERAKLRDGYAQRLAARGTPVPQELQPDYDSYEGLRRLGLPVPDELVPDYDSVGKATWPDYWPIPKLLPFTRLARFWWALYQQDPRPDGTQVFAEPARFRLADWGGVDNLRLDKLRLIIAGDPAASAKKTADHSAAVLMGQRGFGPFAESWIFHCEKAQELSTDFVQRLLRWRKRWPVPVAIEAVAGFKAVPQVMRLLAQLAGGQAWACPMHGIQDLGSTGHCGCGQQLMPAPASSLPVIEVPAVGDKLLRATLYSAAWNDGRVYVPIDADWADWFIEQHRLFTGLDGAEDDAVDAGAIAFNQLYREHAGQTGPIVLPFEFG